MRSNFILRGIPIQQGLKQGPNEPTDSEMANILRGIPIQQGLKHIQAINEAMASYDDSQRYSNTTRIETRCWRCLYWCPWSFSEVFQYNKDWNRIWSTSYIMVSVLFSEVFQYNKDWNILLTVKLWSIFNSQRYSNTTRIETVGQRQPCLAPYNSQRYSNTTRIETPSCGAESSG